MALTPKVKQTYSEYHEMMEPSYDHQLQRTSLYRREAHCKDGEEWATAKMVNANRERWDYGGAVVGDKLYGDAAKK